MSVIVDSSVWIDYFRGAEKSGYLDYLIDENVVAVNDLILTELIPFLKIQKQQKVIRLLQAVQKIDLTIKWTQIRDYQYKCLEQGFNGIGIPDLIIAQNTVQNNCELYTLDRHFEMIRQIINIELIE